MAAGSFIPDQLDLFLEHLRIVKGYSIGAGEYKLAYQLLVKLAAHDKMPVSADDWAGVLMPVLCKNAHQQIAFREDFSQWMGMQEIQPSSLEEISEEIKKPLKEAREKAKLWQILIGVTAGLIMVVLFSILYINTGQSENPKAPTIGIGGGTEPPSDTNIWENLMNWVKENYPDVGLFVLDIILLILLVRRSRKIQERSQDDSYLSRLPIEPDRPFNITRLFVEDIDQSLFFTTELIDTVKRLNNPVYRESNKINIYKSILKTVNKGGFPCLENQWHAYAPHYLIFIDQRSYADHQVRYLLEMIKWFEPLGVAHDVFYFDEDPCDLYSEQERRSFSPEELARQYGNSRLLVFSSVHQFVDPYSLNISDRGSELLRWPTPALFVPETPSGEDHFHAALMEYFDLFPATPEGLEHFINLNPRILGSDMIRVPDLFTGRLLTWLEPAEPPLNEVGKAIQTLVDYLGTSGFLWLSACAVYPEIKWQLTLYLGHQLLDQQGEKLFRKDTLIRLMQLPWYRSGRMPDWLRVILIDGMNDYFENQVRNVIYNLFIAAYSRKGDKVLFSDLIFKYGVFLEKELGDQIETHKNIINRIFKKRTGDPLLQDGVFQEFISRQLSVKVPRRSINDFLEPQKSNNRFFKYEIFTDARDGKRYRTITINGLTWIAENFDFDTGEGCWIHEDYRGDGEKYGRLYTWEAANKACPQGWRMPTVEEWEEIVLRFGGYYDWPSSKEYGDSYMSYQALTKGGISGLSLCLGGWARNHWLGSEKERSGFGGLGKCGYYWCKTEVTSKKAWYFGLGRKFNQVDRSIDYKTWGFSSRYVQGASDLSFKEEATTDLVQKKHTTWRRNFEDLTFPSSEVMTKEDSLAFSTDIFVDPRDGRKYKTVQVGDLIWFCQNLSFEVDEGSWLYDNNIAGVQNDGRLYTWEAAINACPPGWRLPTDEEWYSLGKKTEIRTETYKTLKKNFADYPAFLGGYFDPHSGFFNFGILGYYWSASDIDSDLAWYYGFYRNSGKPTRSYYSKALGFSCRCVKDTPEGNLLSDKKQVGVI